MSGGEYFTFGIYRWNIDKAKELIEKHPRKPIQVSVKNLASTKMMVRVDEEYAKSVDLREPVILGWVYLEGQWYHILIDGNHRLHKAMTLKRKKLPAYLLTKEENYQILEGLEKERFHPEKTYISDYLKKQANKRPSRDQFYRKRIERFISQIPEENWQQEATNYQKIREELVLRDVPFEIEKNKFLTLERMIFQKKCLGSVSIDWIYFGGQHPETKFRAYLNLNPESFDPKKFCQFISWFNKNLSRVAYAKIPSALFSSRFYKHHDSFVIYTILDQEGLSELLETVVEKLEELGLSPDSPPSEEYIQPESVITHSFHGDLASLIQSLLKQCVEESQSPEEFYSLAEDTFQIEGKFTKLLLEKGIIL